jgi:hypothetical protein
MKRLYDDHPSLQKTWRNLIRVFLTAEGRPADNETMRQYQKKGAGSSPSARSHETRLTQTQASPLRQEIISRATI